MSASDSRRFVIVCANGREREDLRRIGLNVAGYDRVELLLVATARDVLRGMQVHGWSMTEWATRDARAWDVGRWLRHAAEHAAAAARPGG